MKNITLSFRAQKLDNEDPDHMEINQDKLTEENVAERQEFAQNISEISLNGYQVFSKDHHIAFLLNDRFLLKTPSDQKDDSGRIAPVITYGYVPDSPSQSWPIDVVAELAGFAGRIDRTICKDKKEVAERAMQAVVNKKRRQRMLRNIPWIGFGIIIVYIVYWVIFNRD